MSESISDIVREMRECADRTERGDEYAVSTDTIRVYADRIEAAYKAQLTDGTMCTMSCLTDGDLIKQYAESEKRLAAEVAKLRDELVDEIRTCERLRDALKPIIDCHAICPPHHKGEACPNYSGCYDAVKEAQRLMEGGEA